MSVRNIGHHRRDIRVAPPGQVGVALLDFECIAPNVGILTLCLGPHPNENGRDLPPLLPDLGIIPYQILDKGPALAPFLVYAPLVPFGFPILQYQLHYSHNYIISITAPGQSFRFQSLSDENPVARWFANLNLQIQIQHSTSAG